MPLSQYLVVDTSAFIRNDQLQNIGENIITIPEVIKEVTSKRQYKRLHWLPYDLQMCYRQEADSDSVKFVTEFSKKTGDFPSLSATDIKIMALTYELHLKHIGADSLNKEPISKRELSYINHSALTDKEVLAGFYLPGEETESDNETESKEDIIKESNVEQKHDSSNDIKDKDIESEEYYSADDKINEYSDEDNDMEDMYHDQDNDTLPDHTDILKRIEDEDKDSGNDDEQEEGNENEDSDGGEWITPNNLKQAQNKISGKVLDDKPMIVSCITYDFAMQNVMKQMGLNVVAADGCMIRDLRTFILRCTACFKTTSIMTKVFCPKCGYKTLKRVAVSVDNDGKQVIHINLKRPLTARGKKYSLPTFKGGKHANNPIVCEDQPLPDQRPTRLARMKTNALDDDYIAGMSPFAVHDINSKSAMLGIRNNRQSTDVKYWMYKNPNAVRRKSKK